MNHCSLSHHEGVWYATLSDTLTRLTFPLENTEAYRRWCGQMVETVENGGNVHRLWLRRPHPDPLQHSRLCGFYCRMRGGEMMYRDLLCLAESDVEEEWETVVDCACTIRLHRHLVTLYYRTVSQWTEEVEQVS